MPQNLSPGARRMLERYRSADSMTPVERQRLLETVQRRIARGDVPINVRDDLHLDVSGPPRSFAQPVRTWWTRATVSKGAALLGASALALTAFVGVHRAAPAPAATSLELAPVATSLELAPAAPVTPPGPAVASPAAPTQPVGPSSPAPALAAPIPAPRDPRPASVRPGAVRAPGARRAAPVPDESARAPSDDTIDAEVRLITEAQSAESAGNPRRALQLLEEHAARFPAGKLADARAVARMISLCSSGQRAVARAEARSFVQRYPHSPFAGRVANICGQDDAPARR